MRRYLLFALLLFVATAQLVYAADFFAQEEFVLTEEATSDTYVTATQVTVEAPVAGDFLVAGREVLIAEEVEGDVLVGGGLIHISGTIVDDVRALGARVVITGEVGGDVVLFGGTVEIDQSAAIDGDVYIFADRVVLAGNIDGDVSVRSSQVQVSGQIGGETSLNTEGAIEILPSASFVGDLRYTNENELEVPEGSIVRGEVIKEGASVGARLGFSNIAAGVLSSLNIWQPLQFLGLLIATLLLYWLLPRFSEDVGIRAVSSPVRSTGYGIAFIVLGALVLLLLLLTIVGALFAWLLALVFFLVILLGALYRPMVLVAWWVRWRGGEVNWKIITLAALAVVLLNLVPIVGQIFNILLWFMAIGALAELLYYKLKEIH